MRMQQRSAIVEQKQDVLTALTNQHDNKTKSIAMDRTQEV
jgi:hypothetical protein